MISNSSSIRGSTFGEQVYIVLNRSMDMVIGTRVLQQTRLRAQRRLPLQGSGPGPLHGELERAVRSRRRTAADSGPQAGQTVLVNQGGATSSRSAARTSTPRHALAANVEYLSSYVYKLVFNDNYWQAVSSEVHSTVSLTHIHNGLMPSAYLERAAELCQFNSTATKSASSICPACVSMCWIEPLGPSPLYWGMGSSISYLGRSESGFHARNMGRFDLYPHLSLPLVAGGWSIVPEVALRDTFYTGSQTPDLTGANGGTPTREP